MSTKQLRVGLVVAPGLESFIKPVVETGPDDVQFVPLTKVPDPTVDVTFCEWANETAIQVTGAHKQGPIVVRCHSYEVFANVQRQNPGTGQPETVPMLAAINWENVDTLVFVAPHVRDFAMKHYGPQIIANGNGPEIVVIPNGVDLQKFEVSPSKDYMGKNVAWVGSISNKKGPELFAQAVAELAEHDDGVRFHVAGEYTDPRYFAYFSDFFEKAGLADRVKFYGKVPAEEMPKWLEDKQFILSTSPWESFQYAVAEGILSGLYPLVHAWPGCPWPGQWTDSFGLIEQYDKAREKGFAHSKECIQFVKDNYDLADRGADLIDLLRESAALAPKPKVGLCMMARANDPLLLKAIESAKGHVDGVFLCLDARHTPYDLKAVTDLVESFDVPFKVETVEPPLYEGVLHFSDFRNMTLRLALEGGMDWAWVLDSDEFIQKGAGMIRESIYAAAYKPEVNSVLCTVDCYTDDGATATESAVNIRGLKLVGDGILTYRYPIHNQLYGDKKSVANTDIVINSSYRGTLEEHVKRSLPSLMKMYEAEAKAEKAALTVEDEETADQHRQARLHSMFYIARSYVALKDADNLKRWARMYVDANGEDASAAGIYFHLINAHHQGNEAEEAMDILKEALTIHPEHPDLNHLMMTVSALKWWAGCRDQGQYTGLPLATKGPEDALPQVAPMLGMPLNFANLS